MLSQLLLAVVFGGKKSQVKRRTEVILVDCISCDIVVST